MTVKISPVCLIPLDGLYNFWQDRNNPKEFEAYKLR